MTVKSFTFDENRQAVIEKEEGSELHIAADTVIFAVGQRPALSEEMGLPLGRGNCIIVKDHSCQTGCEGFFAAGDAVYGTKSVVMAVASGRAAASEIDCYLGGDGDISEVLAPLEPADPYLGRCPGFGCQKRVPSACLPAAERLDNFRLVDCGIGADSIGKEAGRCLQCDLRLQIEPAKTWKDFGQRREEA